MKKVVYILSAIIALVACAKEAPVVKESVQEESQEIKVNMAYRWFLGLGLHDSVPHFSTFGKNYMRRFQNTDLFERIFQRILKECMEAGLVDESVRSYRSEQALLGQR